MKDIKLADIALILGCSVPAASLLRNRRYGDVASESSLPERYERLVAVVEAARHAARMSAADICLDCPREDCTGCRVAEIVV